jgi:hypothetical protein
MKSGLSFISLQGNAGSFNLKFCPMKRILIFSLLCFAVVASCKKEKGNDEFYFRFTVDGTTKAYSGFIAAHLDTSAGYVELTLLGANSQTSFDDNMGIYINDFPAQKEIRTGQYDGSSPDFTVLTTYTNSNLEYESGQSVDADGVLFGIPIANHFKVNITAMDKQSVRGNFSGDYYLDGDVQNGTKLTITSGEFNLKFF